jgi:hypothetical protein
MKTVLEQLIEVNEKLSLIEKAVFGDNSEEFTPCCTTAECGCGCDELETETETNEEQVILIHSSSQTDEPEQTISFTKKELIEFTVTLTKRALVFAKEAVADTSLDADDLVSLELNTWSNNTIEVELDKDTIVDNICSGIDDAVMLDDDSVEDEIGDVLRAIGKIS